MYGDSDRVVVPAPLFLKRNRGSCVICGRMDAPVPVPAAGDRGSFRCDNSCLGFLCFAQSHPIYSGGSTIRTAFFGVTVSPSISQRNCCCVSDCTSCAFRGHWNWLSASRLYKRSQPSPSQTSPLIRSERLPQNRYRFPGT